MGATIIGFADVAVVSKTKPSVIGFRDALSRLIDADDINLKFLVSVSLNYRQSREMLVSFALPESHEKDLDGYRARLVSLFEGNDTFGAASIECVPCDSVPRSFTRCDSSDVATVDTGPLVEALHWKRGLSCSATDRL